MVVPLQMWGHVAPILGCFNQVESKNKLKSAEALGNHQVQDGPGLFASLLPMIFLCFPQLHLFGQLASGSEIHHLFTL